MSDIHNSPTIFAKSNDGLYTFISPEAATLFQRPVAEFIDRRDFDIFGPEIGFDSQEIEQRVLVSGKSLTTTGRFPVNEQMIDLQITRHLYQATPESAPGIIGIIQVIRPDKKIETGSLEQTSKDDQLSPPATPAADLSGRAINRRLLNLSTAVASITTSLNQEHILESFTWEVVHLLEVPTCSIYSWQPDNDTLLCLASYRKRDVVLPEVKTVHLSNFPFLKRVMVERGTKQLQQNRLSDESNERAFLTSVSAGSVLLLPLVFREKTYGLVQIASLESARIFSDQDISISQLLTDQTAGSLANAWLYEELNEVNKSLAASNEELDAFAHMVAHDLKSPLSSIIGFADLVANEQTTLSEAETHEFLDIIAQNGRKMRSIIDSLLTLASVRREQVQLTPLPMTAVLAEVQARLFYMMREYEAELILATDLPECIGYMPWLEEVWVNYLSNGLKYGGRPPKLTIGANRLDNGMIRYWVQDNGAGLTEADQEKLFFPFARLDTSIVTGHGLGLSIVKRIITRLGGEVGVVSEVGKGSEFFFILPGT